MPNAVRRSAAAWAAIVWSLVCLPVAAQQGAADGQWRTYGGDLGSTRYSPLEQIDASNFQSLELAWRFRTDNLGPSPDINLQATPLMVDGVLYAPTGGSRRTVVAIDGRTGELVWSSRMREGERAESAPRRLASRGVAYWSDGRGDDRVFYVTTGYRLVALDAGSGRPVPGFGTDGAVDLRLQFDQDEMLPDSMDVGLHAAPLVAGDVVIVGAAHTSGARPRSYRNVRGYVRAFDVRTGERKWIFHTIPRPNEPGYDTWLDGSAEYTGNTGVWAQVSADEELGLAYLPVEAPTGDFYGGHRPGDNLFSQSLVAVDLQTGERRWHFQMIHHDIWDWDPPAAPILADVVVDGRPRKIVAQPTKQAWLYVFDRETGEPIWPIEERAVPQTDVPGEWTSPTQPFPTKPPAYDRQGVFMDDLIGLTPELNREAREIVSRYRVGPMFTPAVRQTEDGPLGQLVLPGSGGGANWAGGSLDPETGIAYVFSRTEVRLLTLGSDPERSDMDYVLTSSRSIDVQGLPVVDPPWGRITAIDLNRGEIVWQVAHGATPDVVANHPALRGLELPRTGSGEILGTLVTGSLVIAGEGEVTTQEDGRRGAMLRAYDKATGREVGAVYMPAPQTGSPMTYELDGVQYMVVAVGDAGHPAEFLAYKLP
jgi:quinoprotein glucose dehydrogenase